MMGRLVLRAYGCNVMAEYWETKAGKYRSEDEGDLG